MPEIRDEFSIKRGNLLPIIQRRLMFADGETYDLTGCTVEFHIAERDGNLPDTSTAVARTAAIVNAPGTDGIVSYTWVAADVDTVGEFFCEFVVTNGAKTISFPNGLDEYILLRVVQDVSGA